MMKKLPLPRDLALVWDLDLALAWDPDLDPEWDLDLVLL